jgi:fructoselysine 6-kinase
MKLISIGNSVMDYYPDKKKMYPGGNALNVAVLSKRYGAEKSSFVGILGNDPEGWHIEKALETEAVNTSRIRKVEGATGKVKIKLDEGGDREFAEWIKGVQALVKMQFTPEDLNYILSHTHLHTSVNSYLDKEIPELSKGISISYDFSTNREEEYLKSICPYIDFAFLSGSDLSMDSCENLIEFVHQLGTKYVVVTRGEHPAILSDFGKIYKQPVTSGKVVDTLGAGDSFISMLLVQFYKTQNLKDAMKKATEAATETCSNYGAFGYGFTLC